jgi:hypothetical protein
VDLELHLTLPHRAAENLAEIARGLALAKKLDDQQSKEWASAAAQLRGAIEAAECEPA